MKIEGYEIIRELFSNEEGLTVFLAKKSEDAQLCIVRLADLSKNTGKFSLDDWYDIYTNYQQKVTNYKYLPQVSIITMIDNTKVYTSLDCEEGVTLKEEGRTSIRCYIEFNRCRSTSSKKGFDPRVNSCRKHLVDKDRQSGFIWCW